ncbi:MAG TPA: phage tail sheath subtilisin-like domain-containing protein [Methanocella sp.]|jgi:hypothetical protein
MTRIIPGVEIQVVKEIVPQQLNPSGVVALIGTTQKGEALVPTAVSSYAEFADKFGNSENFTVTREAKMAFANGVFQVVVVPITGQNGTKATLMLKDRKGKDAVLLTAKPSGEDGNKIQVKIEGDTETFRLSVSDGNVIEIYDGVTMVPSTDTYLVDQINNKSAIITAADQHSNAKAPNNNPAPADGMLYGGVTGVVSKADYESALDKIEGEPDVDMVAAPGVTDPEIFALIEAHCMRMSMDCKNRIGIGTIKSGESIKDICDRTTTMASDRFILVAPSGCVGAVAGMIGKLNYFESPTFKSLSGLAKLEAKYTPSEQMEMLKAGVVPLEAQKGRGIVVVKGISTSKEQISVTRIADHAVRGVKGVSDLFIGTLNSANGRAALKGKITEFLSRMESEGAIVPSTDGSDPAFLVDVYSTQLDFAQGIVRVNIAVRPVRAMDYIYATIKVEA